MTFSKLRIAIVVAPLFVLMLCVGGCGSDQITAKSVRKDMSPELHTMAMQREEQLNMYARTIDTNNRQIWDDLDRILLLDRPTRLSEYPVP